MDDGWRTSSYTEPDDTCVMVKYLTATPDTVDIGDTKDRNGPKIRFSAGAWNKLIRTITGDTFHSA